LVVLGVVDWGLFGGGLSGLAEEGEDDLVLFWGYEQVRWTCEPSPEQYLLFGKWRRVRGRKFFASFDLIQRCSVSFQGCRWLGGRRGGVCCSLQLIDLSGVRRHTRNGFRGRSACLRFSCCSHQNRPWQFTFSHVAPFRQCSNEFGIALNFRNGLA